MPVDFSYSAVSDLIYHLLAHMPVANASNLYSGDYTAAFRRIRPESIPDPGIALGPLAPYYQAHFDRLGVINFLPLECASLPDCIGALASHPGFTPEDQARFIRPFQQIMQAEWDFYHACWQRRHSASRPAGDALEQYLAGEMGRYQPLLSHFHKSALIGLSYSLTNNGRGYGSDRAFRGVIPFPAGEQEWHAAFFQLLHEFTHQFTDQMVALQIRMGDGSHDASEKAVLLFDYFLIEKLQPSDMPDYLQWMARLFQSPPFEADDFLSVFDLESPLNRRLMALAGQIAEGREA